MLLKIFSLFSNKPKKSRARLIVNLCLLLTLILLSFLLSGATSSGLAVRGTYIVKLHYWNPEKDGKKEKDETGNDGDDKDRNEDNNDNDNDNDNDDDNKDPGGGGSRTIPSMPPVMTSNPSKTFLLSRGQKVQQISVPNGQILDIHTLQSRAEEEDAFDEKPKYPQMDIHLGYYGMCVTPYRTKPRCMASRATSRDFASMKLFPSLDGTNQTVGTTLTTEQDPGNILGLAVDIQKSLSPVPLVLSIISTGFALIASLVGGFIAGRNRKSPVLGAGGKADVVLVGCASIGFALLLMGVVNFKVAGDVAAGILDGGVEGIIATQGFHGLRLGTTCLVWLGLVAVGGGLLVVRGLKKASEEDERGSEFGFGGGVKGSGGGGGGGGGGFGLKTFLAGRERKEQDKLQQWKDTISRPVPIKTGPRAHGGGPQVHMEYV